MKMIMTGQRINAQRAHQLGVVQEVFGSLEALHQGQMKLAEEIASNSLYALSLAKESTKFAFEESGNAARILERASWRSSLSLPGGKEGIGAFIQKRKPDFRGL